MEKPRARLMNTGLCFRVQDLGFRTPLSCGELHGVDGEDAVDTALPRSDESRGCFAFGVMRRQGCCLPPIHPKFRHGRRSSHTVTDNLSVNLYRIFRAFRNRVRVTISGDAVLDSSLACYQPQPVLLPYSDAWHIALLWFRSYHRGRSRRCILSVIQQEALALGVGLSPSPHHRLYFGGDLSYPREAVKASSGSQRMVCSRLDSGHLRVAWLVKREPP